jgi:pimeloyl-ACP methyl ester carboxylesterase
MFDRAVKELFFPEWNKSPNMLSQSGSIPVRLGLDDGEQFSGLLTITDAHFRKMSEARRKSLEKNLEASRRIASMAPAPGFAKESLEYLVDLGQRWVLFLEALHRRSGHFLEHEAGKTETVLIWDHEVILDGAGLKRPVNYSLVRISPPRGVTLKHEARPYIIIDPRAGHGSGIGGFKHESEVGCAINAGHPVYFVTFSRLPKPGQTLADVCAAEAEFVREVRRLHPDSPKPIVIGNCQGGWAAMLLAATNPDITGPVVANGAPLSYWAGVKGRNPMRYLGGVSGGITPVLFLSDLGNGLFDGANLVLNFEKLSPSNTWWRKYYDLFSNVDEESPRFLEFERWWSSAYFMTEAEIRWILENLFIGNRLARGRANLDESTHLDLRKIQSPIILFASHGDNITPPPQALGWIADNYRDVEEIRTRGARILYTLHESVGHLGIFVSSKTAHKEHREIVTTLDAIEALAPGLYEMRIIEETGEGADKEFRVAFEERTIEEAMAQAGGVDDEKPFAAAARLSEFTAEIYELTARPFVKAMASQPMAEAMAAMHPLRWLGYAMSDRNPWLAGLPRLSEKTREERRPADPNNRFVRTERALADVVTQWWDSVSGLQDFGIEMAFNCLFDGPAMKSLGEPFLKRVSDAPREDPRSLLSVQDALDRIEVGGFPEGVIRMLILLAQSRHEVRRSRLERSNQLLMTEEPFASMKPKRRTRIIHRQSLIVGLEPKAAMATLPKLLETREDRTKALELCWRIAGPREEMVEETLELMKAFARLLEVEAKPLKTAELEAPQQLQP